MSTDESARGRRPKLLLAEDDANVARALRRLLREHYDVIEVVTDGETVIQRTDDLRSDVVVADVGLTDMDGLAATKVIRERHPTVPIVVLTGRTDPFHERSTVALGVSAYLPKMEVGARLLDLLQSLLG